MGFAVNTGTAPVRQDGRDLTVRRVPMDTPGQTVRPSAMPRKIAMHGAFASKTENADALTTTRARTALRVA